MTDHMFYFNRLLDKCGYNDHFICGDIKAFVYGKRMIDFYSVCEVEDIVGMQAIISIKRNLFIGTKEAI